MKKLFLAASSALALAACGTAAQAAELSILYNFTGSGTMALNGPRSSLTIDANGNLYGTAIFNSSDVGGGVYKLARQANGSYAPATAVAFFGRFGTGPRNPAFDPVTLDAEGNIYGAATQGGANGSGGVYKIAAGTSTVTTLASFVSGTAAGSTGITPVGALVRTADGTLWGTNANAGAGTKGTVYKVAPDSGVVTTVASFAANGLSGATPFSGLIADGKGNLYGSTQATDYVSGNAASGAGTLFKVDTSTGQITTLATFAAGGVNGATPLLSLALDDAGNLFGTTTGGGASSSGVVFKLAAGASTITTLASFDGATTGGSGRGLIIDSVGNLFGVTATGSFNGTANGGAVWKLAAGSSKIETLASFSNSGTGPRSTFGGLVADAQGNLYGTTYVGGTNNLGTVFKVANAGYGIAPTATPPAVAAVPEPATWGMMLLGFGLVGRAMRARRRVYAALA